MLLMTIANKGGIGKTTISAYAAEFLKSNSDKELLCIDTDPENKTFAAYKPLNAVKFDIKNANTNDIDKGSFDEMIELILDNKDKNIVIDNGAGSFNALNTYMDENDIIGLLKEENIDHAIIGIVAGAGNTVDSMQGFKTLVETFDTDFILFNNQIPGSTIYKGKELKDTKVYDLAKDKLLGVVEIEKESEYITDDILEMTKLRLTFNELKTSTDFKMMQKRRLIVYRDRIFDQLKEILDGRI